MQATQAVSRTENLALVFQEMLTAVVRLRSNRQAVSDAESFRFHMREALKAAAQEARNAGYEAGDIKMATFAAVAFLDESILNSRNPLFADWPRKPLQEELFGTHMAGEVFFQNLQELLGRSDSPQLADTLEVYYLCMLLGFGGRYSIGSRGELKGLIDATAEKIRRIRGRNLAISPAWQLPSETVAAGNRDPLLKILAFAAAGCALLMVLLFIIYKVSLGSGAAALQALAVQAR